MSKYQTPNGKSVSTYVVPNTTMYAVQFDQGGSLPERLWGHFTREDLADKAIENYLATLKPAKKES